MLGTEGFISLPSYFDLYICSLLFLHGPPGATNIVLLAYVPERLAYEGRLGGCLPMVN
jgi:hypothetical protein